MQDTLERKREREACRTHCKEREIERHAEYIEEKEREACRTHCKERERERETCRIHCKEREACRIHWREKERELRRKEAFRTICNEEGHI